MKSNRLLRPDQAVLLIVDVQEKFLTVIHEMEHIVKNIAVLIQTACELSIPVIVSEQYPEGLGGTVEVLSRLLPEGTAVFKKTSFGCLGEPEISSYLRSLDRRQVIVTGIETHICVNQTVHQLIKSGYEPHLIEDGVSSRDPVNIAVGLRKMIQSGAIPSCVEMALFELTGSASHPSFKVLRKLVK